MKSKAVSRMLLTVLLTGLLVTAFNIETIGGASVFFDDFNDGNDDGWTASGVWLVDDWEYFALTLGDGTVISTVDQLDIAHCAVETKVRFEESGYMPGFRAGIIFRYNYGIGYYSLEVSNQFDIVVFVYYSPGKWGYGEVFASAAYPVSSNVDYTLTVVARGSTFKGYVNGVEVVSGTDVNLTQGKVGLRARNAVVFFDNFAVYSLPPRAITILSPQNKEYTATSVPLTFIVNGSAAWMGYSLDGQANVTLTGNTTFTGLLEGMHYVVVYANDTAGNLEVSDTVYFTVDLTPPTVSILSPQNTTYTSTSVPLTFTVNEPTSWIGYSLDDEANVTISGNTTLTIMIDGSHTVIVYANDTARNPDASNKVSFTIAVPPVVSILSPENASYAVNDVPLTFIVDEPTDWISYSLDNQVNLTISGNTTLTSLGEGAHGVVIYANDTVGHMGSSTVYFTVDTLPPMVSVLSPENTTYAVATVNVPLTFTVNEPTSWIGYSLDDEANVTISGNTTLTIMTEGPHSMTVYANDTTGNTGLSNTVFFTVERLPCSVDIADAFTVFPGYRPFETTEAFPHWTLPINVTVNNEGTLPFNATVNGYYTLDNATWLSLGPSQPISLDPSDGTLLTFYWNLRATGALKSVHYIKLNVTATSENLTSTDEFLVKVKVRVLGDSDGDNDVDVGDQRKLALTMFEASPDQRYLDYNTYPLFTDMDGDGDVDIGDSRKQQLWMFKTWEDP